MLASFAKSFEMLLDVIRHGVIFYVYQHLFVDVVIVVDLWVFYIAVLLVDIVEVVQIHSRVSASCRALHVFGLLKFARSLWLLSRHIDDAIVITIVIKFFPIIIEQIFWRLQLLLLILMIWLGFRS